MLLEWPRCSAIQLFVQVHVGVIYIIAGSGER